jgi:hypothetical protein
MDRVLVFAAIVKERERQEALKASGKFKHTNADLTFSSGDKIKVIGEEFGEVCCASLNVEALSHDGLERSDLKKELIQLAAVTVAWLECL